MSENENATVSVEPRPEVAETTEAEAPTPATEVVAEASEPEAPAIASEQPGGEGGAVAETATEAASESAASESAETAGAVESVSTESAEAVADATPAEAAEEAAAPTLEAGAESEPAAAEGASSAAVGDSITASEGDSVTASEGASITTSEGASVTATGDGAAKKGKAKKGRRGKRRPGKIDEVVPPTPEDIAGISSEAVRAAVEAGHPVEGLVIGWNQGGFHVAVDGVTGFCPRSSMELGAPKEPAQYLDKKLVFRVLRVEDKGHRLVLSHASMLREERKQHAEELKLKMTVGSVLQGRVISLTDFGAFVDLGGVEGLIHVSEIKHQRVAHPSDALAVGQEVEAKVIKLASGGDRVSLSMRALEPDPWDGVAERFPTGGTFTGKVLRKTDFGWFVELEPGIEGLLHHSQLLPGMGAEDPRLAAGETLEGWVRESDSKRKRISLTLRETPAHDPWLGVEGRYAEGSMVQGTVEKVERFGAFIALEPGLTGLLPNSEMGLPRGANVARVYPVGKEVKLQIAQVDSRRRRISLTIEGKTLEGSRSDYQAFLKQSRRSTGLGAMAAALEKLRHDG
ncbi:MAG: S1 RNA-binding domain-containing protein [Holophagales bacterium]|nr:S1 RNA-binding domain-containing protein [Holophagales bacterium]